MKKLPTLEIEQESIYDMLPDSVEFKKTEYYKFSKEESSAIKQNIQKADEFLLREETRKNKDPNYYEYMKNKYTQFSRKGNNIYKFYKEIYKSSGKCAYCYLHNHDTSELDHYFPKNIFPSLSITVNNLVPSCSYCNEPKNNKFPTEKEKVLLNPYFDDCLIYVFDILKYKIKQFNRQLIVGDYYFDKVKEIDNNNFLRIKNHFEFFNLNYYYSNDFISSYEEFFYDLNKDDGDELIKSKLIRKRNYNKEKRYAPWLYAAFNALIDCQEFYDVVKKYAHDK